MMFIKSLHKLGKGRFSFTLRWGDIQSEVLAAETSHVGQIAANWHHGVTGGQGGWGRGVCSILLLLGQSLPLFSGEHAGSGGEPSVQMFLHVGEQGSRSDAGIFPAGR